MPAEKDLQNALIPKFEVCAKPQGSDKFLFVTDAFSKVHAIDLASRLNRDFNLESVVRDNEGTKIFPR